MFGWARWWPAPPSRWPLARTAGAREHSLGNAVCSGRSVQGRARCREGLSAADKARGSWGACVALYERLKVFLYQRTGCGGETNRQHGGVKAFLSHVALHPLARA